MATGAGLVMSEARSRCECPFLRTAAEIQRQAKFGLVVTNGRFTSGNLTEAFTVMALREDYGCDGPSRRDNRCPWSENLYHQVDLTPDERVPLIGKDKAGDKETGQYM